MDNLDRCRADYVVELLEGIQTLFKRRSPDDRLPMVLYVAAADRVWLCESYLTVYDEFKESVREPGRPFGQAFLDKVFNFSLRIPTVSAALSLAAERASSGGDKAGVEWIRRARCELDVRRELAARERADGRTGAPVHELRRAAVHRLAELEHQSPRKACHDTEDELRKLAARVEPGPMAVRHLAAAYCVQRTQLLLAGHAIDDDPAAIRRLGLWTILTLRWPLLEQWLQLHPGDVDGLPDARPPAGGGTEIAQVYALPEAKRFGALAAEAGLDAGAIGRFTNPIDIQVEQAAPSRRFRRAETAAQPTAP